MDFGGGHYITWTPREIAFAREHVPALLADTSMGTHGPVEAVVRCASALLTLRGRNREPTGEDVESLFAHVFKVSPNLEPGAAP